MPRWRDEPHTPSFSPATCGARLPPQAAGLSRCFGHSQNPSPAVEHARQTSVPAQLPLRCRAEARMTTHFNWLLDGSIVGLYLLATMIAGVMVRRYVGRVEDFLVAGREMNVYLGIASLAATEFGIITCMYTAQAGYKYGFAGGAPGLLQFAAMLVVALPGFSIKQRSVA